MQETQGSRAGFVGQEDPLEKEMATYSTLLAWGIPWTVEPGGLQSMGSQRVGHNSARARTHTHTRKYFGITLFSSVFLNINHRYLGI